MERPIAKPKEPRTRTKLYPIPRNAGKFNFDESNLARRKGRKMYDHQAQANNVMVKNRGRLRGGQVVAHALEERLTRNLNDGFKNRRCIITKRVKKGIQRAL